MVGAKFILISKRSALGVTDLRGGRRDTGIKDARGSAARTIWERRSITSAIIVKRSIASTIREMRSVTRTIWESRSVASAIKVKRSVASTLEEMKDAWSIGSCADCVTLAVELKLPL